MQKIIIKKSGRVVIVANMRQIGRQHRKSFGVRRMGKAIGRAIAAASSDDQAAIRRAAASALLCGCAGPSWSRGLTG
jgi:hypothetical protein